MLVASHSATPPCVILYKERTVPEKRNWQSFLYEMDQVPSVIIVLIHKCVVMANAMSESDAGVVPKCAPPPTKCVLYTPTSEESIAKKASVRMHHFSPKPRVSGVFFIGVRRKGNYIEHSSGYRFCNWNTISASIDCSIAY